MHVSSCIHKAQPKVTGCICGVQLLWITGYGMKKGHWGHRWINSTIKPSVLKKVRQSQVKHLLPPPGREQ